MLVFIDDSGDPGFKIEKGSTKYFVIAMVIFDDELEAEKTAVAIKELKRDVGFSSMAEFRFFKTSKDIRVKFFKAINKFNFKIRCIVVDKSIIRSTELRSNKNSFYSYFIKESLKHSNNTILDAKIRIDGGGDRIFRKNFISYLRRELNSNEKTVMKNCRMVDSKSNVLIQLADMIAGSINRDCTGSKSDCKIYKQIIRGHIINEWHFK